MYFTITQSRGGKLVQNDVVMLGDTSPIIIVWFFQLWVIISKNIISLAALCGRPTYPFMLALLHTYKKEY